MNLYIWYKQYLKITPLKNEAYKKGHCNTNIDILFIKKCIKIYKKFKLVNNIINYDDFILYERKNIIKTLRWFIAW